MVAAEGTNTVKVVAAGRMQIDVQRRKGRIISVRGTFGMTRHEAGWLGVVCFGRGAERRGIFSTGARYEINGIDTWAYWKIACFQ